MKIQKIILGPGGLMDVLAIMLDDGTYIPASDGIVWSQPKNLPESISTAGESWIGQDDPRYWQWLRS